MFLNSIFSGVAPRIPPEYCPQFTSMVPVAVKPLRVSLFKLYPITPPVSSPPLTLIPFLILRFVNVQLPSA